MNVEKELIESVVDRLIEFENGVLLLYNLMTSIENHQGVDADLVLSFLNEASQLDLKVSDDMIMFRLNHIAQQTEFKWQSKVRAHEESVGTVMKVSTFQNRYADDVLKGDDPILPGDSVDNLESAISKFNEDPTYQDSASFGGQYEKQFWVSDFEGKEQDHRGNEYRDMLGLHSPCSESLCMVRATIQPELLSESSWMHPTAFDGVKHNRYKCSEHPHSARSWNHAVNLKSLRSNQLKGEPEAHERVVAELPIEPDCKLISWEVLGFTTIEYSESYSSKDEISRLEEQVLSGRSKERMARELIELLDL